MISQLTAMAGIISLRGRCARLKVKKTYLNKQKRSTNRKRNVYDGSMRACVRANERACVVHTGMPLPPIVNYATVWYRLCVAHRIYCDFFLRSIFSPPSASPSCSRLFPFFVFLFDNVRMHTIMCSSKEKR